jgi:hypothetical protein
MIAWGGEFGVLDPAGDQYDPATDERFPIPTSGAPSSRLDHTAVWTGNRMVVWGGDWINTAFNTGGRYHPATRTWAPTSTINSPSPRQHHTAVWTGGLMIVWGGESGSTLNTGGVYALGHTLDDDGDSVSECQGDCNDGDATVYPGAPEVCDGQDNDCNGSVDDGASPPIGIPMLAMQQSGSSPLLLWTPVRGATAYDLISGDLGALINTGGNFGLATQACLDNDLAATSLSVIDIPATGSGFWYLARPVGCGGHGTYDSGGARQVRSRDPGINSSLNSCP